MRSASETDAAFELFDSVCDFLAAYLEKFNEDNEDNED
jgi:hypothetical protein